MTSGKVPIMQYLTEFKRAFVTMEAKASQRGSEELYFAFLTWKKQEKLKGCALRSDRGGQEVHLCVQ